MTKITIIVQKFEKSIHQKQDFELKIKDFPFDGDYSAQLFRGKA